MGDLRIWSVWIGCALITAAAGWWLFREDELPPIARDVPYASIDGNLVFSERVRQHYPVGMKILELRAELKQAGFVLEPAKPYQGDGNGRLVRKSPLCRNVWAIEWQANQEGRIRLIAGSFDRHCIWD